MPFENQGTKHQLVPKHWIHSFTILSSCNSQDHQGESCIDGQLIKHELQNDKASIWFLITASIASYKPLVCSY